MKIELCYINEAGCEWLNRTYEVPTLEEAKLIAEKYTASNEAEARSLSERWERNGETRAEAELWSYCNCEDNEWRNKILDYLEELEA
jgi:hypothetical protein